MLSVQILIPTYNKSIDDIKKLCSFWNIESDVLVSVQTDFDEQLNFNYKNYLVTVIFNKTRGVSVNRNILIDNCTGDIGLFIDDDCSLVTGYSAKISSFYEKYSCDCVCFNGFLPSKENKVIHKQKTKRICRFRDVSSVGAPGLSFKKDYLKSKKIRFDEMIGTPNFVVLGEDSFFVKNLIENRCSFYRSNTPVFKIEDDLVNSSYFKSFGDYRFLISKGYVYKKIYKEFFACLKFLFAFKLTKKNNNKYLTNLKLIDLGASLFKKTKFKKIIFMNSNQETLTYYFAKYINRDLFFELLRKYYSGENTNSINLYLESKDISFVCK